jgi:hypothetical protein
VAVAMTVSAALVGVGINALIIKPEEVLGRLG